MGLNPAHRFDAARRAKRETEQIRQLRKRPHGHAEAKTFVVPRIIDTSVNIPAVVVALDPDNTIPEVKTLYQLWGLLEAGTCDLTVAHNGTDIGETLSLSTTPTLLDLTIPRAVAHGDYFKFTITAASSASDLSVALMMVTRQA